MNINVPPGTRVEMLEMTPERKQRFMRVACEIVTLCQKELNPVETAAVLHTCLEILQQHFGIQSARLEDEDLGRPQ